MSTSGQARPPKKDRREEAREHARLMRAEQVKRDKRRRLFLRGGIGIGLLAVVAVVALVIVNNVNAPAAQGPANMASDGILLGSDGTTVSAATTAAQSADAKPIATDQTALTNTANIVVYLDYLCPICGTFETTNGDQITKWVTAGNATVEFHPISILDRASSGTKYSTRAANAAACVADYDPNKFLAFNTAMFAGQPAENSSGLTDAELTSLVQGAGVTSTDVASCITDETYSGWVAASTQRALDGPIANADIPKVEGTPTVLVNGVKYTGSVSDAAAFEAFVTAQTTAAAGAGE
ncbi:thioredoxin domain-containing protein [Cryobacterium sp. PH31-L1]|uniref:DsbA family protein n=1 Tax=Cryobacterium sp. PH31-L1 TaxID=3046199 RepID=UPI0024B9E04D|nr:thioredoxin domain-containing protein [Cryobacterium sp. PH31-L1]MDJ0376858.1 thioredoxin domain-containing protein [Cryobacterium sp. PH31-L1]